MSDLDELERNLRQEMTMAVADARADQALVTRLVGVAKREVVPMRRRRVWISPILAAAVVVAIVVITSVLSSSPDAAPRPPVVQPGSTSASVSQSPTALDSVSSSADAPTSSQPASKSSSTAPPVIGSINDHVLGPFGLGQLALGMTREQALASGELSAIAPVVLPASCSQIFLAHQSYVAGDSAGWLSPKVGITSIAAPPDVKTPEGVGAGSTIAEVMQAYPSIRYTTYTEMDGGPIVGVPGNPDAIYWFPVGSTGRVLHISISLKTQSCFD